MQQPTGYLDRLKNALVGDPRAEFVFLCNFEVEREWGAGLPGLPGPAFSATAATVRRMEELGACLAGPGDRLLLGRPLDASYRAYLSSLGFTPPREIVVAGPADGDTVDRVLLDGQCLDLLAAAAERGAYLMPMGSSATVHKIADATGLRPAVADPDTAKRVNSKIYSRRVVEELGLRPVPGACCETVGELADALAGLCRDGRGPVVVKDAYGVSGRGLVLLEGEVKARRLLRMVQDRARRTGHDALGVVVERFLPKRCDLYYQFTVDQQGGVDFDLVLETLVEKGVPRGNRTPADLTTGQLDEIRRCAVSLGRRLHRDGYFGVVGVDAILGHDGDLYPVLEINARLNLPTYQRVAMDVHGVPGGTTLSKHYPLWLARPIAFDEIRSALGDDGEPGAGDGHAVISCFGTVNAQADGGGSPFPGRLYASLFAKDQEAVRRLDQRVNRALRSLSVPGGPQ